MWCDAMLVLIHAEWPRARQELLAPTTSSTHAVVQAWMQAKQVQVGLAQQQSWTSHCGLLSYCGRLSAALL